MLCQEHPSLRGTPLAMLAAQCNKLSNKSPPPLADAAVGKGFHPWKKSPQQSSSPTGMSPQHNLNQNGNNSISNNTQRSISSGSPMNNLNNLAPARYSYKTYILVYKLNVYFQSIMFNWIGMYSFIWQ